jgi:flagellar L-ring protein precursor FlgH
MTRPTLAPAIVTLLLLGGCAEVQHKPDPAFAATYPEAAPEKQARPSGGIYQASYQPGATLYLFEDVKPRRPGDVLTVVLVEETSASKAAKTATSKKNSTDISNPTLLGSPVQFGTPGFLPLESHSGNGLGTSLEGKRDFAGSGNSSQSNSLTGRVTVTVAQVLANGNLVVRGEKWLKLNQGEEYVQISGIVRPADIRPDNTVLSTQVADARIAYTGKGAINDANVMGWLARFFTSAIFPF